MREFGITNSYDIEMFMYFNDNVTATMTTIDMIFVNISLEIKPYFFEENSEI